MNELTVNETSTAIGDIIDYKEKALEYLNSMGNKLPQKQLTQFVEMAQAFGLNPFKREIYAVGYGENWNIITGYEVYLKRAERIGKLDGWKATIAGSGETMTATVTIYRKDWKMPFEHTVLFSEVCQKTKDGKLNNIWAKMPSFMCRKVAIAQAFRLCFPDEFAGMPYIADEMPSEEDLKNITPNESTPKNFNGKEKLLTIKTEKPAQAYTTEQATELGKVVNAQYENGESVFNDVEKTKYRNDLKAGNYENAIEEARDILNRRLDEYEAKVSETLAAEVMDEQ